MKLFDTATAKLSREVSEILLIRESATEVEKLCKENEVLLNHNKHTSDIEVSGKFGNLICIYNSLSKYLKDAYGISADHFDINENEGDDSLPPPSEIEHIVVEWDASLPRKEEIKEEKNKKSSSSNVPDPIVLSINLNEFSANPPTNRVPEIQTVNTVHNDQSKDVTGIETAPESSSTTKDIKTENSNDTLSSVGDEKNNVCVEKVTLKQKKSNRRKLNKTQTCTKRKPENDISVVFKLKQKDKLRRIENKQLDTEENVPTDTPSTMSPKQIFNREHDAANNEDDDDSTSDIADFTLHQQQNQTSCKKGKVKKAGSGVSRKKAKPQRAKLKDLNKVDGGVEDEDTSEGKESSSNKTDPNSTYTSCPEDKKIAKRKRKLSDHFAQNHKDKLYKCSQCDVAFSVKKDLNKHEKQHGDLQYCCEDCGKMYRGQKAYLQHKKSHEEGYKKPEFLCSECGKSFSTKYVLQYHVKSEHLGIKKSFLCPTCGKSFTQKYSYILHANVHLGIRPYVCEICGDSFPYEKSLKEHKYMHDDVRRFQCKECGKKFRQPSALHTHMKIHQKSKEHLCGTCGKGFTQKQALLRHERIHSGDKPFSCNLCSRTFSDASIIRRHMIMVHKISPSEWRSEVTSNITSHNDFFVEMLDGDKQPQLKKKGRPPAKAKTQPQQGQPTDVTPNNVPMNEQAKTTEVETTVDPRASAALTLSSLAVGGIDSSTVTKQTTHIPTNPDNFLQKPPDIMPCELQQISVPSSYLGINNYTAIQSAPLQVTSTRADAQPVLYSNYPTVTQTLPHIQTMDKDNVGPSGDAYQVDETEAVRNDQWSTGHYPYLYLSNYSQYQQIQ